MVPALLLFLDLDGKKKSSRAHTSIAISYSTSHEEVAGTRMVKLSERIHIVPYSTSLVKSIMPFMDGLDKLFQVSWLISRPSPLTA
jgi:hypothetical protein